MPNPLSNLFKRCLAKAAEHRELLLSKRGHESKRLFVLDDSGLFAKLYIYAPIGDTWWEEGVTAKSVRDALVDAGNVKKLDVYVNSPGGDVFEGKAIYTQLRRFAVDNKAEVVMHIDGLAASAASFIAMAGTKVITSSAGMWMVHNAWSWAMGNSGDMEKMRDLLDKLDGDIADMYASRTKKSAEKMRELMRAETWMTASEALEHGFTDEVEEFKTDEEKEEETAENRSGLASLMAKLKAHEARFTTGPVAAEVKRLHERLQAK